MKTRSWMLALAAAALLPAARAITPPGASAGPVKLLACVVSATGILEAEVDSDADEAMFCNIRCNYELGERMFSHTFSETVPARFSGRLGRFDTSNARAGSYSGELGTCKKVSR